jgi:hypothetical protein
MLRTKDIVVDKTSHTSFPTADLMSFVLLKWLSKWSESFEEQWGLKAMS